MRKPAFCICKHEDTDQLRVNREADQRLCFRYTNSTIPLLHESEYSSLKPSSLIVQPGLCGTWSETPKTGFLTTRLIWYSNLKIMECLYCSCRTQFYILFDSNLLLIIIAQSTMSSCLVSHCFKTLILYKPPRLLPYLFQ